MKEYTGLGVVEADRLAKNRDAWRLMNMSVEACDTDYDDVILGRLINKILLFRIR